MTRAADADSVRTREAAVRDANVVMETARGVVNVVGGGCVTGTVQAAKVRGESEETVRIKGGWDSEEAAIVAKIEEMTARMTVAGAESVEMIVAKIEEMTARMAVVGAESVEMIVAKIEEMTAAMTVIGAESAEVIVMIGASEWSLSVREKTGAEIVRMRGQNTTRWTSTRRSNTSTRSVDAVRKSSNSVVTR